MRGKNFATTQRNAGGKVNAALSGRLGGHARRALRDERGAASMELCMWFPFFVLIVAIITDASVLFLTQGSMWDTAREAARRVAISQMTADEVEPFVQNKLISPARSVDVAVEDGDEVIIELAVSMSDATIFDIFTPFYGGPVVAQVTMLKEPVL